MATHLDDLYTAIAEVTAALAGVDPATIKVSSPKRPEHGDFAVPCFTLGANPAETAKQLAAKFAPTRGIASATAVGPFVNYRVDRAAAFRTIVEAALGDVPLRQVGAGQTICIDYGSPNISKHLAYHHIRSTTIGHALVHIFRALGYRVIGINHLGDWGTTHGELIAAYKRWDAREPLEVAQLNALYQKFTAAKAEDPAIEREGRAWFKRLEDGDPDARALWQRFRDVSWHEFDEVYRLLGIQYEEVRGESAYEADLPRVLDELTRKGLVVESEGARVVFLDGEDVPCMLVKSDGATTYTTRDVAAALYRWTTYHPVRSLYVVDRGQSFHFRQLFKLLAKAGYDWAKGCEHVPFGVVTIGGKKGSSRLGNVVLMRDVFQIAEDEVRAIVREANADLAPEVVDEVARDVGIGAVVFANLAPQRDKNFDFDLDKAVSLTGDSGPYLQYSHARCAAIFRKAGQRAEPSAEFSRLTHEAEWAVARRLVDLPDHVARAATACEPHVIAHYLLALAGDFSRWYTLGNGDPSLRVLCDDALTRAARLALVAAVQATLRRGLALLGLAAPEQM
jgi:arginyl-tRNA synthetase